MSEIKMNEIEPDGVMAQPSWEHLIEGREFVGLDVGAGKKESSQGSDFLTVDLYTEADINAPMWYINLPDESVDAIYCNQALEHVSKFMVMPTLLEWKRLLKPGGAVMLIVPDLEWAVSYWLAHQTVSLELDFIYGNQHHEGQYHKTGFSLQILLDYIKIAGDFTVHQLLYKGGTVTNLRIDENGALMCDLAQRSIVAEFRKNIEESDG